MNFPYSPEEGLVQTLALNFYKYRQFFVDSSCQQNKDRKDPVLKEMGKYKGFNLSDILI